MNEQVDQNKKINFNYDSTYRYLINNCRNLAFFRLQLGSHRTTANIDGQNVKNDHGKKEKKSELSFNNITDSKTDNMIDS